MGLSNIENWKEKKGTAANEKMGEAVTNGKNGVSCSVATQEDKKASCGADAKKVRPAACGAEAPSEMRSEKYSATDR